MEPSERVRIIENISKNTSFQALKQSMRIHGLLQPIVISQDYRLIAGYRRFLAALQLGWKEIECTIVHVNKLERKLLELEENILRQNLKDYEFYVGIAKFKRLYEKHYPLSKRGGYMKNIREKGQVYLPKKDEQVRTPSFLQEFSELFGISKRSLSMKVRIGEAILSKTLSDSIINKIKKGTITQNELLTIISKKTSKRKRGKKSRKKKIPKKEFKPGLDIVKEILVEEEKKVPLKQVQKIKKNNFKISEVEKKSEEEKREITNAVAPLKEKPKKISKPSQKIKKEEIKLKLSSESQTSKKTCLQCSRARASPCPFCFERVIICIRKNGAILLRKSNDLPCKDFEA